MQVRSELLARSAASVLRSASSAWIIFLAAQQSTAGSRAHPLVSVSTVLEPVIHLQRSSQHQLLQSRCRAHCCASVDYCRCRSHSPPAFIRLSACCCSAILFAHANMAACMRGCTCMQVGRSAGSSRRHSRIVCCTSAGHSSGTLRQDREGQHSLPGSWEGLAEADARADAECRYSAPGGAAAQLGVKSRRQCLCICNSPRPRAPDIAHLSHVRSVACDQLPQHHSLKQSSK